MFLRDKQKNSLLQVLDIIRYNKQLKANPSSNYTMSIGLEYM